MTETPQMPPGLKTSGRRLWSAVVDEFDLAEHEVSLLVQACRTADALDGLQGELDADGPIVESPQGRKAHPALPELRQQRIAYARLLVALGLPSGVDDEQPAAGRRGGARGVYVPQRVRA